MQNKNPINVKARTAAGLTLNSSDRELVEEFNWNKEKALSWVTTYRASGNMPAYWAGYDYRDAFYGRDTAHQVEAAHLLGLDAENLAMLKKFAQSSTEARGYYPIWAFGFDGSIYDLDYKSDTNFVRELPSAFDLLDKCNSAYMWTGDSSYINDPVLMNFYDNTMSIYITSQDEDKNGVPEAHGVDLFKGISSYNEWETGLGEASDAIACEWAAYRSYINLLIAAGDNEKAALMRKAADNLASYFANSYWSPETDNYYRGRNLELTKWIQDFGKESHVLIAVKGLAEPGDRANALLEKIHCAYLANHGIWNEEAYTYLPEAFYNYFKNTSGWYWLKNLLVGHYHYPENSFLAIDGIARGMMGIIPDAPGHKITTLGRLTRETDWVELDHITLGSDDLLVRHEKENSVTTIKNNSGPSELIWEAQFVGDYFYLYLNGEACPTNQKTVYGKTVSYITVIIPIGQERTVCTGRSKYYPEH